MALQWLRSKSSKWYYNSSHPNLGYFSHPSGHGEASPPSPCPLLSPIWAREMVWSLQAGAVTDLEISGNTVSTLPVHTSHSPDQRRSVSESYHPLHSVPQFLTEVFPSRGVGKDQTQQGWEEKHQADSRATNWRPEPSYLLLDIPTTPYMPTVAVISKELRELVGL